MASNIEVKLDVLNQLASPALYAAALANRPAASFTGRLFVDSDAPSTGIYRDTGTTWVQVADLGAGTTGTLQQVTTNGSSTTVGISTSGNGIGIGTTIPASNRLDIHSASGINATFNGTGVTNAALQFQLAGTGKWNVGNLYNSAANDFIITDVVNTLNRVTIKNTGQTFIGADTTSSGLFVVNSSTSDNHYVAIGSNAPSYRLRDVGSGGALNCGIGISTAVNNFIQGSASGNFCFFNSSSTASPILFGVYDAGTSNTQEAIRISAARNLLIGTTTDGGYKLSVSGTAIISSLLTTTGNGNTNSAIIANNTIGSGAQYYQDFTAGATVIGRILRGNGASGLEANGLNIDNYAGFKVRLNQLGGSGGTFTVDGGAATFSNSLTLSNSDARFLGGDSVGRIVLSNSNTTSYLIFNGATNANPYIITLVANSTPVMTVKATAVINLPNVPTYATNALALAGGLVANDVYKTAAGTLLIVF